MDDKKYQDSQQYLLALGSDAKRNKSFDAIMRQCRMVDDVSCLRSVLNAIPKWEEFVIHELKCYEEQRDAAPPEEWPETDDYLENRYLLIEPTKNALFAGLAVTIASLVEKFMKMICKNRKLKLKKHTPFGGTEGAFEEALSPTKELKSLPGYYSATRARLLANSFKHNGGIADKKYIEECDSIADGVIRYSVGEEIRYQDEDWNKMIDGVYGFLLALLKEFPLR